jgi:hypothetical protein
MDSRKRNDHPQDDGRTPTKRSPKTHQVIIKQKPRSSPPPLSRDILSRIKRESTSPPTAYPSPPEPPQPPRPMPPMQARAETVQELPSMWTDYHLSIPPSTYGIPANPAQGFNQNNPYAYIPPPPPGPRNRVPVESGFVPPNSDRYRNPDTVNYHYDPNPRSETRSGQYPGQAYRGIEGSNWDYPEIGVGQGCMIRPVCAEARMRGWACCEGCMWEEEVERGL